MFKMGDEVMLSYEGVNEYKHNQNNPHFTEGTIIDFFDREIDEYFIEVCWSNGHCNYYREEDLQHSASSFKEPEEADLMELV